MPCPAAVTAAAAAIVAAAAAVGVLTLLGPGLSPSAVDNSEADVDLCSQSFYRGTPPRGSSAGTLMRPLCHALPKGQALATLSKPNCDTAACSAFHLRHGWAEGEEKDLLSEEEDSVPEADPAPLRGDGDPSTAVSPIDSPLQSWVSAVKTLVSSGISTQCGALGGDLYVLTGVGGLQAGEDGGCQADPLWTAVCCSAPEAVDSFSVGLIRETGGEENREVSIKQLQETLGVAEMFSEGCGADVAPIGAVIGLPSEGGDDITEEESVDVSSQETVDEVVAKDTADLVQAEEAEEVALETSKEAETLTSSTEEQADESGPGTVTKTTISSNEEQEDESGPETVTMTTSSSEEQEDESGPGAVTMTTSSNEGQVDEERVTSESAQSSDVSQTVEEQEADDNSTSTLVYILCTTLSIMKAPLHPVISTVTNLPGQVTYVLQEDLGVLSGLPGDTFSLLHLLTCDFFSWMGTAADLLLGVGGTCVSNAYHCTSSMTGALLSSCYTGVTGVGTLAGDTVGVFGGTVDNAWWVTKFFGGRLWDNSGGYVGGVVSELGGQVQAVGGGLGRLVWRCGNGVFKVFRLGGGIVLGVLDLLFGSVGDVFGQGSE